MQKYVIDTNVFIEAFRDPAANAELQRFHLLFAPFEYMSAVVAQELIAGTGTTSDRRKLERHVLAAYARRNRLITPSARTWEKSGPILADLVRREGLELRRVSKAFGNDILIAISCREAGCILVTDNTRDFERIARVSNFRFVEPFPAR